MELANLGARRLFGRILCRARCYQRWHFGVTLNETNPNCLSTLLGISNMELFKFLKSIGLMKEWSNGTVKVNKDSWSTFLIEEKLDDIYFDRHKVNCVPTSRKGYYEDYNGFWVGVGNINKFKGKKITNPKSQFKFYDKPPVIGGDDIWNELKLDLQSALQVLMREEDDANNKDNNYEKSKEIKKDKESNRFIGKYKFFFLMNTKRERRIETKQ